MTAQEVTPTTAIIELSRLSRQLDALAEQLKDRERRAVNAEHSYRVAKAKALLAVDDGTVAEREAKALLAVTDERMSAKLAEAELRIVRNEIRVAETRIEVGRSVVGVLRAEAQIVR